MSTSSDPKIQTEIQHLEELKKYRGYNYKGEDKEDEKQSTHAMRRCRTRVLEDRKVCSLTE